MNEQVTQNKTNERVEKIVVDTMEAYSNLPAEDQILMSSILKKSMIEHRLRMIDSCKSDLEAVEYRLKSLYCGLEELQMETRQNVVMQAKQNY